MLPFTISLFANCSHIWGSHVCQIAELWLRFQAASSTSPKRQLNLQTVQGQENCLWKALGVIRHSLKKSFFLKEGTFFLWNFCLSFSRLKGCFRGSLLEVMRQYSLWLMTPEQQFCPAVGSVKYWSRLFISCMWRMPLTLAGLRMPLVINV